MRIFDIEELLRIGCLQKLFVSQIERGIGLFESKLKQANHSTQSKTTQSKSCASVLGPVGSQGPGSSVYSSGQSRGTTLTDGAAEMEPRIACILLLVKYNPISFVPTLMLNLIDSQFRKF